MTDLSGYRIDGKLGEGGFALVYKGTQLSLDRPVAIKLLKADLLARPELKQRFERESRLIAKLNHPHIVHVIDCGFDAEGRPFYVMEHIKGVTLQQALATGAVSLSRKLDFALQMADALAYAHKNGIVHRDIKPANVLIDFEGCLKLADFGIALESGAADVVGEVAGTAAYMAPEQWLSGHPAAPASDIYAFGTLFYQMLVGQLPGGRVLPPSQLVPQLPAGIDELVLACLEEASSGRPSAERVRQRLRQIMAGRHLSEATLKRATDTELVFGEHFQLLDVLKDDPDDSLYLYDDSRRQQQLVLRRTLPDPVAERISEQLMKRQHGNIARILGLKSNERFLVVIYEYLGGGSLEERLLRPWHFQDFLRVALPLSKALAYLHRLGILHGNIQARTILFDASGVPKISGVGFAGVHARSTRTDVYALILMFSRMLVPGRNALNVSALVANPRFWKLPWRIQLLLLRACCGARCVPGSAERVSAILNASRDAAVDRTRRAPAPRRRQ